EPAGVLPAEPVVVQHPADHRRRGEALTKRAVHDFGRFVGDVETYLVQQGDGSYRKAPASHRVVDQLDRYTLLDQNAGLVEIGGQDPVDPEPRVVMDHDHRLAEGTTEPHRGSDGRRVGTLGRDDFQ